MSRYALVAALLVGAVGPAFAADAPAAAPPAPTAAAGKPYTSAATTIGTLLDDPAAKAILVKYIPELANSAQIDMARGLTLKQIQAYSGDRLSDETLGKIDWDLSKLPAK
jgi:hypothetical protein